MLVRTYRRRQIHDDIRSRYSDKHEAWYSSDPNFKPLFWPCVRNVETSLGEEGGFASRKHRSIEANSSSVGVPEVRSSF